jgi:mRNA interferase MazF
MPKKLTITVDAEVYDGLHSVIGRRRISRFLNDLARPHVVGQDLAAGYAAMASDEARETEAEAWSEALVAFDPAIGGEIQKTRPAVVLSNDTANALLNRVQVVPVSSQIGRLYPAEAYISLNGERRKAMADQITTASKRRLLRPIGALSRDDTDAVARAVRIQLDL